MTTKIVLNQECNLIIALQEYVQLFFPHKLNKSTGIPAFHSVLYFNYKVMTCLPRAIWASQPVHLFQWIVFIGSKKLQWREVN